MATTVGLDLAVLVPAEAAAATAHNSLCSRHGMSSPGTSSPATNRLLQTTSLHHLNLSITNLNNSLDLAIPLNEVVILLVMTSMGMTLDMVTPINMTTIEINKIEINKTIP